MASYLGDRHFGESDLNEAGSWDAQNAVLCDRCRHYYDGEEHDECPDCDKDTGAEEENEE